jgi:hypothetical protein
MSDKPVVHIGENSPEQVAYRLMRDVLVNENNANVTRKLLLDTFAECLEAVKGYRNYRAIEPER